MLAVASVVAFAIALLMHLFGWGSGKVDVLLFTLIGFLCLALDRGWSWYGTRRGA
jgi:hypothetical protein